MNQNQLVNILIIDDDEDDFIITSSYIKEIPSGNFQIDWSSNYEEGLRKICSNQYDIYFIDYFLGGSTGLELLKNAILFDEDSPFIFLTGQGNREIYLALLEVGAADYLIKSELNAELIERSIRYALENAAAKKKIRDSEKKFRTIFEKSHDGIFIANPNFELSDFNITMSLLTGYTHDELCQFCFYDLIADDQDIRKIKVQLNEYGGVREMEIGIKHISGAIKPCIFSASLIRAPDKQFYIQGMMHDISKLRKAERSLILSEKLAATGRLARILAHEIRNPLTNINLSVDQLKGTELYTPNFHYFEIIERNSLRINDLLTELLVSSRPTHITKQHSVLQEILNKSIEAAMDRILLKNVQLEVKLEDNPVHVMADVDKLSIAFLNIIINAIEAIDEKYGFIIITLTHHIDGNEVRITDNGNGIPEENIPKLFEPYYTVKRNGIGLGLSTALNILKAHDVHIDVSSSQDSGTTFSLFFPMVKKASVIFQSEN